MAISTLPSSPAALRNIIRNGEYSTVTAGLAPGYVQANLVILPEAQAFDFLLFCQRNPKPCPLIEVVEAGSVEPSITAPGADIRTDLPKYRVYRDGVLEQETADVLDVWRDDLVSFLIGCSFTFETALLAARIPMRHIEENSNVSMYITNMPTVPAGQFAGPTVVSMRPIGREKIVKAVQVTSRFPNTHGAPLHVGDPASIGIDDLQKPDYGDVVPFHPGEVPVFLGMRRHPSGRGYAVQAAIHDYPLAGAHVHHGRPRRRPGRSLDKYRTPQMGGNRVRYRRHHP